MLENPMLWLQGTIWLATALNLFLSVYQNVKNAANSSPISVLRKDVDEMHSESTEAIKEIRATLKKYEEYLTNDKLRLDDLEEGNRVSHRLLLALARHEIDGNHDDELKSASDAMDHYLINK